MESIQPARTIDALQNESNEPDEIIGYSVVYLARSQCVKLIAALQVSPSGDCIQVRHLVPDICSYRPNVCLLIVRPPNGGQGPWSSNGESKPAPGLFQKC